MIFRPRIFISSTFSENIQLRNDIKEFLLSVGAEPLLYERNLTPSTIPLSYRENIKDADFVILIIKEKYGTPTKSGLSGIHEEYKITAANKIPTHVYLKKHIDTNPNEANPLVDVIKSDNISFFYFDDDSELVARLKETIFTIAREIMIFQIEKNLLPEESIFRLSCNHDYNKAIEVIKIVEGMHKLHDVYDLDYIDNALFLSCIDPIVSEFKGRKNAFIDSKITDSLQELLKTASIFLDAYSNDYTSQANYRKYSIPILNEVSIGISSESPHARCTRSFYLQQIEEFHKKYNKFVKLVTDVRLLSDMIE